MTQQKPFDDTFKYELILLGGPTSEKYFLREMPMQWAERLDLLTRPCRHDQDNASMAYRYDHDNKSSWLRPLTPVIFSLITQTIIVLANHSKSDWQSNHKHRQEKKLQFNHNHQPKKLLKWLEKLHFDRQSFGLQQARSTEIVFVYIFSWKNRLCLLLRVYKHWWKNFFFLFRATFKLENCNLRPFHKKMVSAAIWLLVIGFSNNYPVLVGLLGMLTSNPGWAGSKYVHSSWAWCCWLCWTWPKSILVPSRMALSSVNDGSNSMGANFKASSWTVTAPGPGLHISRSSSPEDTLDRFEEENWLSGLLNDSS